VVGGILAVAGLAAAAFAAGYTVDTTTLTIAGAQKTVLTDAQGMTLYYFSVDTATQSACIGKCAATWPAVVSATPPTSEGQLPGKLSVVRTANGSQVAYNGHLLYRYAADTAPGQANGQGVVGKWWVATVDLKPLAAAPMPPSGGYGDGGYGGGGGMGGGGNSGGSHY
jgi:predicted lipoprotein with Yx(FWY)xxD motif